jgi:dipeptidyl aminopeptidase/acylaminoacyl peptidase
MRIQTRLRCNFPAYLLTLVMAVALVLTSAAEGLSQDPGALGHEAYERWRTIGHEAISPDGRWVHYTLEYEDDDGILVVRSAESEREHRIERGDAPTFTADGAKVVFRIRPHAHRLRAHRRGEGNGTASAPPDSLGILDPATGEMEQLGPVQRHALPADAPEWLAFLRPFEDEGPSEAVEEDEEAGTLVLRSLVDGSEATFSRVSDFVFSDDGSAVAFVRKELDTESEDRVSVYVKALDSGEVTRVMEGAGEVSRLVIDREGGRVAFLHAESEEGDGDRAEPTTGEHRLHLWDPGLAEARVMVESGTPGIPEGWEVAGNEALQFSSDGTRLFLGTMPRLPTPDWDHPLDQEVDVEVWHWEDELLMTVQNVRLDRDGPPAYTAVLLLEKERVVQLADEDLPSVQVERNGEDRLLVGTNPRPYALMGSWESPDFRDIYLVEVETGERARVVEGSQGTATLSPGGRYLTWYEPADSAWFSREVATGRIVNLSEGIGHPVHDETNDQPMPAGSYGSAGWLEGDEALLLHDRYDVWAVSPDDGAPRNLTGGQGRENGIRFRVVDLDPDEDAFDPHRPLLLAAFHEASKDGGFYRIAAPEGGARDQASRPEPLLMEPYLYSSPVRARDGDRLLFTRQSYTEFPDLWVAGPEMQAPTRISRANPQQEEYRWGTAELVEWISTDGVPLEGILLKPEDFDPDERYPMIVYFYERNADRLHAHYAPVPHRSIINFPMYTSHGYLVFIPDIEYRIGYPGESALNAVTSGVHHLLARGFVDRERIGLQGHSWGGYQIAFIVTRSRDLFRAAAAGAPVANMTSAYGGIRRETGLVRQFQYERTQSRLAGSLWEVPIRYFENSPLFWVDKIETPLLIMHNDADGHVPWEQGIELFTALRRLGKPAWMINYRGEPHWPTTFANRRDWNIRMRQFFDHYLLDAPAPEWMVEGVPAVDRGRTLGYDPVPPAGTATDGTDHRP